MQPHITFNVTPRLPESLEPLREISLNLWWSWEPSARKLFWSLDEKLWEKVNHSPVRMLQLCRQSRLEAMAADDDFLRSLDNVYSRFRAYLARTDTYGKGRTSQGTIAYFSAEFGFHESIPIYSGGLGILSGDHCKSASDLDLDFVAVTLLYRHGYFRQQINRDGMQEAIELDQNFHHLPIEEVTRDGDEVKFTIELPGREVTVKVWQMKVGRVTLYLLDTDLLENRDDDRVITAQLYGGDKDMRIRQEIVLGIGGVRTLHALGVHPQVYHMNEGHSAFLSLQRIADNMERTGIDFASAIQVVAASNVFTTHTPVPAGNEVFARELFAEYLGHYAEAAGIPFDRLYSYGLSTSAAQGDPFSMTVLALRTSRHANGVAKLHGAVSREMWKDVWKGVPVDEVPITSITNGIHTKTWLSPDISALYDRHLGSDWEDHLTDPEYWRRIVDIPSDELWETHQMLKARLVQFIRTRVVAQRQRHGDTPELLRKAAQVLDSEILTIGFARRFATYKRAVLLFSDPERLLSIIKNSERPVQFVFAGKSHPADDAGQRFIQQVIEFSRTPEFEHHVVFLEDYDHHLGRRLYQGVDLWLNNPLRPLEASGTSGMKLPPNGGLNFSVLDGWWPEAYNGENGWPIGEDITDGSLEFQNKVDANSLYHTLENRIIPLFYAKPDGHLPVAWINLMRESMRSITPAFNTHRMVMEYNERLYEKAAAAHASLGADGGKNAKTLSKWKAKMRSEWEKIKVVSARIDVPDRFHVTVADLVKVQATVQLNGLSPDDVAVQAYFGDSDDNVISWPKIVDLELVGPADPAADLTYEGMIPTEESGSYGVNVRIIPRSDHMTQPHELRLIRWATGKDEG
ncbi:glycosyltransferase family 1 protein [soil metagenome]